MTGTVVVVVDATVVVVVVCGTVVVVVVDATVVVVCGTVVVVVVGVEFSGVIAANATGIMRLGSRTIELSPVMDREAPHAYRKPSVPIASDVLAAVSTTGNAAGLMGAVFVAAAAIPRLKR